LVKTEMGFIVLWFQHQRRDWERRKIDSEQAGSEGHRIYACKQIDLWRRFEQEARAKFHGKMVDLTP